MSPWLARVVVAPLVLGLGWTNACKSKEEPSPSPPAKPAAPAPQPQPVAEDAAATARELFRVRCSVCHGSAGRGDGPGAAALNPKPRMFGDSVWQDSVTDAHIGEIIVKGGPAVGKSPGMPSNPDLETKPEVVRELVKVIRSLKL
jgi:mono/diheme cytochrome c family protein